MSLVATVKDAPRLLRRQTSMGLQTATTTVIDRPVSPQSGHMRLVSASAALPPASGSEFDHRTPRLSMRVVHTRSLSYTVGMRQRSPSTSRAAFTLRRPSPSASRNSSPSPIMTPLFTSPPNVAARSPLYSPRSPLGQAGGSPTNSYFPTVPSRPTSPSPLQLGSSKPVAVPHPARADAAPVVGSVNLPEQRRPPHAATAPLPPPPAPAPAPPANSQRKHTRGAQSYDLDRSSPVPTKPAVVDLSRPSITMPSPLSKATEARMPDLNHRPPIDIHSTRFAHALSVHLPGYAPDEVTLTVARNEAIKIVADKWSAAADDKCASFFLLHAYRLLTVGISSQQAISSGWSHSLREMP